MINISYYMYLGFFLMDCEFYYYTVRFCCCIYWLLIYFRYILALVHVYYIIHFVGDLVNISDNSLIFNWQPLQNHATYLLTEMKKKSFRNRLYLFPWAKYPIFLNIKSPKQKQKNKTNSTIFFLFFIIEYCKTNIFYFCTKPPPPIIFSSAFLVNFVYFSYSKHHINDIIILCMKKDTFRHEIFRPVI